jgi:hypothetical protein
MSFSTIEISNSHNQLIKSILSEEKNTFLCHWNAWKKSQDFEKLDYESRLLIPLLLEKIELFGIQDENTPRYEGIAKKNWVEIQLHYTAQKAIEDILKKANIPFKYFNENAINLRFSDLKYPIKSKRISILMHPNTLLTSKELLIQENWTLSPPSSIQKILSKINYLEFNKENVLLTVYFHPTRIPIQQEFESSLFTLVSEIQPTNSIEDTFTIYLLLLRSQSEYYIHKITWIIFIKKIATKHNSIDWDMFITYVNKNKTTLFIVPALRFLNELDPEQFPKYVIEELSKQKITWIEKIEYHLLASKKKFNRKIYYFLFFHLKNKLIN